MVREVKELKRPDGPRDGRSAAVGVLGLRAVE